MVQTLLDDATPMLLEPFRGFPEPGSIYEGLETTEAKADKYCTVIAERTKRARSTGYTDGAPHGAGRILGESGPTVETARRLELDSLA